MLPGQCYYVPIVDETGGMLNDPVAVKLAEDRWWSSIADSDLLYWIKGLAFGYRLRPLVAPKGRGKNGWPGIVGSLVAGLRDKCRHRHGAHDPLGRGHRIDRRDPNRAAPGEGSREFLGIAAFSRQRWRTAIAPPANKESCCSYTCPICRSRQASSRVALQTGFCRNRFGSM